MRTSTLVAVKALIECDPPRIYADLEDLLHAMGLDEGNTETPAGERIVSFEEAARRLACTKRTLHNIVRRGGLKKVRFPGLLRAHGFLASDIDSLLARGKINDVAEAKGV